MTAAAREMAGLRCAPGLPKACATRTPQSTPSAQPVVITIQPASAAYDLRSVTPAHTPVPSSTRTSVPINSPNQTECISPSFKYVMGTLVLVLLGTGVCAGVTLRK